VPEVGIGERRSGLFLEEQGAEAEAEVRRQGLGLRVRHQGDSMPPRTQHHTQAQVSEDVAVGADCDKDRLHGGLRNRESQGVVSHPHEKKPA
jgi:hypothetical protein